jgi:hypothetical protein
MKKKLFALALVSVAFFAPTLRADDLDNLMVDLFKKRIADAATSFEKPANFDANARTVRWKTVFQTGYPCPVYETWRTKESKSPDGHQLHLQFKQAVNPGTILAFASDSAPTEFTLKGKGIQSPAAGGVAVAPTAGPVSELDIFATSLQHQILFNWGGYKKVNAERLSYYQLALAGLYAIEERRLNIAPCAEAKVSGTSLRQRRENAERPRNRASGLNDRSTYHYWRSNRLKKGETAQAELIFPQAVTVREVALHVGFYLFSEMPQRVTVTALDAKGDAFELGILSDFTNHMHTGRHFYLLKNRQPERKIKTLKFHCEARKDAVYLSEILVLASPEDNPGLSAKSSADFAKKIEFAAQDREQASGTIVDEAGRTVKSLVPISAQDKRFTFAWDGTDNAGKIVQPGRYRVRGVGRNALRALYESTPYSPVATPWVTPSRRGGWLSDHHGPSTIERLGDRLWVGTPLAESGDTIMTLDFAGRKYWGVRWLNLAGAKFIRSHNDKIYAASCGGWIGSKICVTELDPKTKAFETVLKIDIPGDAVESNNKYKQAKALTGFAVSADYLALAFERANRIEFYDRTGKKTRAVSLPSPRGLRYTADGKLLAVSGNKIVSFDSTDGQPRDVISQNLLEPRDVVLNQNRLIVPDSGDHSVKVFATSGELLCTIGAKTPRRPGAFEPTTMDNPVAVAVDDQNHVWVAEDSLLPKRISVWNLNSGEFVRDYLGPARYEGGSWLDPEDDARFYAEGMVFQRRAEAWTLQAIYDNFTSPTYTLLKSKKGGERVGSAPERALRSHGKLFLARDRHWANAKIWYGVMGDDQVLRSYAALGSYQAIHFHFKQRPPQWNGDPDAFTFLWVDRDRDGEMQWEELQFLKARYKVMLWSSRLGKDLDFYFVLNDGEIYKLATDWQGGWPTYDLSQRTHIVTFPKRARLIALAPLPGKRLLVNSDPLTCLDETTGKTLWTYPNPLPSNSHDSQLPEPGQIQHTLNIEGSVEVPGFGDVFLLNGNKGLRYLFSVDGIYIGQLFRDVRLAAPLSIETVEPGQDLAGYSLMDEAFNGSFERSVDGKVRFSGGKNQHSLYVVDGLDSLRRFEQTITFDKQDWEQAAAAQGERQARELNARLEPEPVVARLAAPFNLTGNEKTWQAIPERKVGVDGQPSFSYRLALDEQYFYGAFKVMDPSPFVNSGGDWKMLFKSGDSVNIELGQDKSTTAKVGDVRLLIARYQGQPQAVLYRYRTQPRAEKPITFGSPVGQVEIDRVEKLAEAEIKINTIHKGYFLEFKIPRAAIPALAGTPESVCGDVGVIFSDDQGRINRYNLFRYSPIKGVTADVPSEIRLSPKYWHEYKIEK